MTDQAVEHAAAGVATEDDVRFTEAALRLGARGLGRTWPNPAVGALVVKDGEVLGRGWTADGGRPHGEPIALRQAGERARGATIYVGLEPCSHHGKTPPCVDAIIAAGISRVVSAIEDPNPLVAGQGYARLRAAVIDVVVGIGSDLARKIHAGHIMRITKNRPYVTLKLAISADGKAGLVGRRPAPITRDAARDLVHLMRSQSDAIAVGIGTVIADDPVLTSRLPGLEIRSPVRVVFDTSLRLPSLSQLVSTARETPVWVVTERGASQDAERSLAPHGVEVIRAGIDDAGIDIAEALSELSRRGITRLMVEGGPILANSFLEAGLVDEAVIFTSPDNLGEDAIPALPGPVDQILNKAGLSLSEHHQAGVDLMQIYRRA